MSKKGTPDQKREKNREAIQKIRKMESKQKLEKSITE